MSERRFVLQEVSTRRYYQFWDAKVYGEPQFGALLKDARVMTAQGCASAKRRLEDPKRWGTKCERVELPAAIAQQRGSGEVAA